MMNDPMLKKIRVVLEPTLESKVHCWTACQRRELARTFERWARQLRVSAKILDLDDAPKPLPRLKALPPRRQRLN
jgi:hypothetical protein